MSMTYGKLLRILKTFSSEELNQKVVVFDHNRAEFHNIEETQTADISVSDQVPIGNNYLITV